MPKINREEYPVRKDFWGDVIQEGNVVRLATEDTYWVVKSRHDVVEVDGIELNTKHVPSNIKATEETGLWKEFHLELCNADKPYHMELDDFLIKWLKIEKC